MKSLRKFLGSYKSSIKQSVTRWFYINKLRQSILIGRGVKISKDFKFSEGIVIRDYVTIGAKVKLDSNVLIGSYVSLNNITVGKNTHIEGGVKVTGYGKGKIVIGNDCYIGTNNILDWSENITIGNFVHIAGPSTGVWTHSSAAMCTNGIPLEDKSEKFRPTAPIIIESNTYIGGNCTIYPGVKIGHHAIVAPNSAVTKNVKPYTLVGGVPAKFIKSLENDQ